MAVYNLKSSASSAIQYGKLITRHLPYIYTYHSAMKIAREKEMNR